MHKMEQKISPSDVCFQSSSRSLAVVSLDWTCLGCDLRGGLDEEPDKHSD